MKWEMAKVGALCELKYGYSLPKAKRNPTGEVPVLGSSGLVGRHDEVATDSPVLVIGRKGSIGKISVSRVACWPIDTTYYVDNLDPRVDFDYFWRFLKTQHLEELNQAAAVPGLNRRDVYELTIPLPPIEEQKRIAAILDKADRLRSLREQTIAKLDQLAQSIFLDMFGDPVTNPKGWEVRSFGEVGALERGKSQHRPRNDPKLLGGPYPLIQTGDVANSGGYIRSHKQTYSELGLKQSRIWPKGTLCITIAANIADTGILTFDACFPDSVVGFSPGRDTNTEFARGWLELIKSDIEQVAPESAQKNINLQILRGLPMPVPPLELQERYAEAIRCIELLRRQYRFAVSRSNDTRISLNERAFKGEL